MQSVVVEASKYPAPQNQYSVVRARQRERIWFMINAKFFHSVYPSLSIDQASKQFCFFPIARLDN